MARPTRAARAAASRIPQALVLAAGLLSGPTAYASPDSEALLAEVRRLADRVGQLEAAKKRLEAALEKSAAGEAQQRLAELVDRMEDVESQVHVLKKPGKVEQALEEVSASAALVAAALHHLLHFELTGCRRSADRAVLVLDVLADAPGMDQETRDLCASMGERLSDVPPAASLRRQSKKWELERRSTPAKRLIHHNGGRGEALSRQAEGRVDIKPLALEER